MDGKLKEWHKIKYILYLKMDNWKFMIGGQGISLG